PEIEQTHDRDDKSQDVEGQNPARERGEPPPPAPPPHRLRARRSLPGRSGPGLSRDGTGLLARVVGDRRSRFARIARHRDLAGEGRAESGLDPAAFRPTGHHGSPGVAGRAAARSTLAVAITHSVQRLDLVELGIDRLELLTQPLDVAVDGAVV